MRVWLSMVLLLGCVTPPARAPSFAPRPAETDSDGDGIPDVRDKCPHEPEDCDGFADDDGCPDPDNDADGIADTCDVCPNEKEVYNGWGDRDGCPDSSADIHRYRNHPTHVYAAPIASVSFAVDSAKVSATELDDIASEVRADGDIESILCVAQTTKSEKLPPALSRARAEAVCKGLLARGLGKVVVDGAFGVGSGVMRDIDPERLWESSALAFVLVTRGRGHQIWKWNGTVVERAEVPPVNVEPGPRDPACTDTYSPPPPKPPAGGCLAAGAP